MKLYRLPCFLISLSFFSCASAPDGENNPQILTSIDQQIQAELLSFGLLPPHHKSMLDLELAADGSVECVIRYVFEDRAPVAKVLTRFSDGIWREFDYNDEHWIDLTGAEKGRQRKPNEFERKKRKSR